MWRNLLSTILTGRGRQGKIPHKYPYGVWKTELNKKYFVGTKNKYIFAADSTRESNRECG